MEHAKSFVEDIFVFTKVNSCKGEEMGLIELDFDEIYYEYSKAVFGCAMELIDDFYFAQDIVQEVFLQLNHKLYLIKNKTHLKAWIRRATVCRCIDYLRKQTVEEKYYREFIIEDVVVNTIDELIEYWDFQRKIDEAIEGLWEKDRRWYSVFVAHYYEEKTNQELADEYGMTKEGVCMLLRRIRKWLGKELIRKNPELKARFCQEKE